METTSEDAYTRDVFPSHLLRCFPYETLTRVQRRVLRAAFARRDNLMVCAPTGSGKTAALEAAFLQVFERAAGNAHGKAVYIAPVKALLQERLADWRLRFGESTIGMKFIEISGDTRNVDEDDILTAHVILTTPEKWDAVTRGGNTGSRLVGSVELLMVDEIHHIGDVSRGATLEAVLLRMMNLAKREREEFSWQRIRNLRIVGLSATFSNAKEIADWIKCRIEGLLQFGYEYRPVPLTCRVVGCGDAANAFIFERNLDTQVLKTIRELSKGKPTIVFCNSRSATVRLARYIASEIQRNKIPDPNKSDRLSQLRELEKSSIDNILESALKSGVGYHHAGLNPSERDAVETMFRTNALPVLCCTSSLAVGVNLPAHLVIVKHTKLYQGRGGYLEYPDSQLMQMIGRAGRPGFDSSGTVVILADSKLVKQLEAVTSGTAKLNIESQLCYHLDEILCAEIALGGVADIASAKQWLQQSFYASQVSTSGIGTVDEILSSTIMKLELSGMIIRQEKDGLTTTQAGASMCQGCVRFSTMNLILDINKTPATFDKLLSMLAGCAEVQVRLRRQEKALLNQMNESSIRYPVRNLEGSLSVTSDLAKTNVLIQAVLSKVKFEDHNFKQEATHALEEGIRVLGVAIDYLEKCGNGRTLVLTLRLQRCFTLRSWDDNTGALCLQQIGDIEPPTAGALEYIGIRSIRALARANAGKIDSFLRKTPPVGHGLVNKAAKLKDFHVSTSWDLDRKGPLKTLRISVSSTATNESPGSGTLVVWIASSILHFQRSIDSIYNCEVYVSEDIQEKIFVRFLRSDIIGLDLRADLDVGSALGLTPEVRQREEEVLAKVHSEESTQNAPSSILRSIIQLETRHAKSRQQQMPRYLLKTKRRLESPLRDKVTAACRQPKPNDSLHGQSSRRQNSKRQTTESTRMTALKHEGDCTEPTTISTPSNDQMRTKSTRVLNVFDKFRFKRNEVNTSTKTNREDVVDTVRPSVMSFEKAAKSKPCQRKSNKPDAQNVCPSATKPEHRTRRRSPPRELHISNSEGDFAQAHPFFRTYIREKTVGANEANSILSSARSSIEYNFLGRLLAQPEIVKAPSGSDNFTTLIEEDDARSCFEQANDEFDTIFF